MKISQVNNITAFVPAKNFQLSCRFYEDLGFENIVRSGNAIRYEIDGYSFWLQDYYVKEWAENCMLCIYVADIHSWHQKIMTLDLEKNTVKMQRFLQSPIRMNTTV